MKKYRSPKEPPSLPQGNSGTKSEETPSFYERVFELARMVPKGHVTTYGDIAEAAGIRLSARMVGWALNNAFRVKPAVPAHRVVNRNGQLSARHKFATPTLMQELLEQEGVTIKDNQVQNFAKLRWQPPIAPTTLKAKKK
jgi:methylated-DNA-protein-cysteine methyltransferase related protein